MEAVTAIYWQRETIVTSESEAAIDLNPFWKQLGESGIHLTTLTNSTIWAKFRMTIDSLSDGRTRQGNGRALFRWKIRLHMSRSVLGLVNSCNETPRMLADNLFHSNICPLLPFGFLLIFFLHLCHLIRQLPKSRSSFFLSSLPPHPGLPERFQLFQLFEIVIVTWRIIQNSNLPTIRIISARLTSDAFLGKRTFPIYNTNRTNYLNCTIYCCLGSTLNSFDKRPVWQNCVFKVFELLTDLIGEVQNENMWPCYCHHLRCQLAVAVLEMAPKLCCYGASNIGLNCCYK